jgi:inhibitor of cysteine peptidase
MHAATKRLGSFFLARLACGFMLLMLDQAVTANPSVAPVRIQSLQELLQLLQSHSAPPLQPLAVPAPAPNEKGVAGTSLSLSHSETNVQVAGVDEADRVKVSDDGHIFQIHEAEVRIIRGLPLGGPRVESTLRFTGPTGPDFFPTELLVAGKRLVVLGTVRSTLPIPLKESFIPYSGWPRPSHAKAYVYDFSNPVKPVLERELSIEGDYLNSRRIGQSVYLLARSYPRYYLYRSGALKTADPPTAPDLLPVIQDSASGQPGTVKLGNIYYFPEFVEPDYVSIAGFRLDRPKEPANLKAYLGAAEEVYASTRNLYLSASTYAFGAREQASPQSFQETTRLFKFALADGKTQFLSGGEVPGRVLNQFSMDEAGDHFRIATTIHNWVLGQDKQRNGVYVLDRNLAIVGRLENLAPGEQIYSARFIGKRGYLVTFRTTDPLFTLDLSVPENPKVLGQLKLPGYSNYLHPYDDTHLIGFGKAAVEVPGEMTGADQFWRGISAFYQGMKLSLFDVSDVAQPKELHSVIIGDRGTDSDVLTDHKALYQNPERHLYGFPLKVARLPLTPGIPKPWDYGTPEFQGAYIYEVTLERGFVQKAAISHLALNQTPDWQNANLFINRLVSLGSDLYSLSPDLLQVHDLDSFAELAEIPLDTTQTGRTLPGTTP